MPKFEPMVSQ